LGQSFCGFPQSLQEYARIVPWLGHALSFQILSNLSFICHPIIQCYSLIGFVVLTSVVMESSVFWDIMPYSLLKVNQHFGGAYHKQSRAKHCLLPASCWFFAWPILHPEDGGDMSLQNIGWCSVDYMGYTPEGRTFPI
jgi:hypothetical protein